jgi:hypothetical protein
VRKPEWFEPKITLSSVITIAAVVVSGVWQIGTVQSSQNEHTAAIKATEAAHYAELSRRMDETAARVAERLAEEDKRRDDLASRERDDIARILAILDGLKSSGRRGELGLPGPDPAGGHG